MVRPTVRVLVPALAAVAVAAAAPIASAAPPAPAAGPAQVVVQDIAGDAKTRAARLNDPDTQALVKKLDDLLRQVPAPGSTAAADNPPLEDILKQIIDALLKLLGLKPPSYLLGQTGQLSAPAAPNQTDPYRTIVDGLVTATADRVDAMPDGPAKQQAEQLLNQVKAEVSSCLATTPARAGSKDDCAPKLAGDIEKGVMLTAAAAPPAPTPPAPTPPAPTPPAPTPPAPTPPAPTPPAPTPPAPTPPAPTPPAPTPPAPTPPAPTPPTPKPPAPTPAPPVTLPAPGHSG